MLSNKCIQKDNKLHMLMCKSMFPWVAYWQNSTIMRMLKNSIIIITTVALAGITDDSCLS